MKVFLSPNSPGCNASTWLYMSKGLVKLGVPLHKITRADTGASPLVSLLSFLAYSGLDPRSIRSIDAVCSDSQSSPSQAFGVVRSVCDSSTITAPHWMLRMWVVSSWHILYATTTTRGCSTILRAVSMSSMRWMASVTPPTSSSSPFNSPVDDKTRRQSNRPYEN